jgi:hypothetical protein
MSTLSNCYVTFGIPSYATGDEWDGDHILFAEVIVRLKSSTFSATQEHRNQPIGAGHAIYLIIPFTEDEKSKIKNDEIIEIEYHLTSTFGDVTDGGLRCRFRAEAVFTFSDSKVIATGYQDPAPYLYPQTVVGKSYGFGTKIIRANFFDNKTLTEPIG